MNSKAILSLLFLSSSIAYSNTFGVTGDYGYGSLDPNSIYHITSNGATTKIADTAVVPNSFAYNTANDVYYYGEHYGTNLYAYDVSTASNILIADLTSHGMPPAFLLSGGADFYNGTYYYSPEVPENTLGMIPQQATDIYAVNFSADGLSITSHAQLNVVLPTGWSSLGDFGDIAVDTSTGVLYGSSWAVNGSINDGAYFWSVDLNDPNKQVQVLGQTSTSNDNVYQIAYDAIENAIFGNEWQSDDYLVIDDFDGTPLSNTPVAGNFYDLASTILPDSVPEPSSVLLIGFATSIGLLRRNRA